MLIEKGKKRDKYYMISYLCRIKKQRFELTDRAYWWLPETGAEAWAKWVKVLKSYKLQVIKYISWASKVQHRGYG